MAVSSQEVAEFQKDLVIKKERNRRSVILQTVETHTFHTNVGNKNLITASRHHIFQGLECSPDHVSFVSASDFSI
jgi:hypothetical protein